MSSAIIGGRRVDAAHLQMRVPGHEDVLLLVCTLHHHTDEVLQALLHRAHLSKQPQAHVRRNLVISRASGVQLPTEGTDQLR